MPCFGRVVQVFFSEAILRKLFEQVRGASPVRVYFLRFSIVVLCLVHLHLVYKFPLVSEHEAFELPIEVACQLDRGGVDEDFELIKDLPRRLLHNDVLVAMSQLYHSLVDFLYFLLIHVAWK